MNNSLLKTTIIAELVNLLNEAIEPLDGMNGEHEKFHSEIHRLVKPIMTKYSLVCGIWDVKVKENDLWYSLMNYTRALIPDKRYAKHASGGRFTEIKFVSIFLNYTVEQAVHHLKIDEAEKRLFDNREHYKELQKEIEQNIKSNRELKNNLESLENDPIYKTLSFKSSNA